MERFQQFSLGQLVTQRGLSAPDEARVTIQGRGIFCRVAIELSFESDDPTIPRFLVVERPRNAVLVEVLLNGDPVAKDEGEVATTTLPNDLRPGVEEMLSEGHPEVVTYFVESGRSLRSITLDFVMTCDILWHRSALSFRCLSDQTVVDVEANWDLSGLPGATLECTEAASESRFSLLDGSRHHWAETLPVRAGARLTIVLALDEKRPASICLYSSCQQGQGCGAVVVVAPVRPQLQRRPVRIAVMVEIRNPQEGLLVRDMVDRLSKVLGPQDEIALYLLGTSDTQSVVEWRPANELHEGVLGQLLEPQAMGRSQHFWTDFEKVLGECHGATHVVLSTAGPSQGMPEEISCSLPVFCFATGRKPNLVGLEALANRTGGIVAEHTVDGIDSFLQRINIRLSPPLLRDFRLEGWGLEKLFPPGVIEVYTDKPTLVLGLYEGLLPQTVTLAGLSPAGQKLAQRVRVEDFTQFELMPLFKLHSLSGVVTDKSKPTVWRGEGCQVVEALRPVNLTDLFILEESDPDNSSSLMDPPSIDIISTELTFADDLPPLGDGEELFGQPDIFADEAFQFDSEMSNDEPLFTPSQERSDLELEPVFGFDSESEAQPVQEPDLGDTSFDSSGETSAEVRPSAEGRPSTEGHPSAEGRSSAEVRSSAGGRPSAETRPSTEMGSSPNRGPMAITAMVPGWMRHLINLEGQALKAKLETCSIDDLALALSDMDEEFSSGLIEQIPEPMRRAVKIQVEWGRLLTPEERRAATESLERTLSS